jgi:membrane-bound lytic murein transglycosylase A
VAGKATAQPGAAAGAPRPGQGQAAAASGEDAPIDFPQPGAAMREAILSDPSYVFFREIPDGPEGPVGALGVSLTAGRSVAVDPRTTPLGFPVFLSTSLPGREGRLNRLVIAQDTGGAIRGAVRADYFWGGGSRAYLLAARMKESGRMWVLFPRDLAIAAREQAIRTRGAGPAAEMECVVEDPELCVEDR